MQYIYLSDNTLLQLREAAALRGLEAEAYAEELLKLSLAVLHQKSDLSPAKPYRAMQFSAVAPTRRTAQEIDLEIEADRDAWGQ